jgi:glucosamine--fructose-6-phosphate aminotransferase (isomerizing)
MCGIVGILGNEPVAGAMVEALKRLEYRGYDSAGVATLEGGKLARRRAEGKLKNLELRLESEPLQGKIGIGHTRWATHGAPNETNAHPHATDKLAVVHNGIIENFRELREDLKKQGAVFKTETDTEVIAHLVTAAMKSGKSPVDAVVASLPRLRGAFALAFIFTGEEDLLVGARKGSPLAVGYGSGEMYLGYDAIALAPFTDEISYLEDGDLAIVHRKSVEIRDGSGKRVERPVQKSTAGAFLVDKGNHRHFMAKEIYEQPEVVGHTLAHYLNMTHERVRLPMKLPFDLARVPRIAISACGTAFYAGMVAKYWFERFARVPVDLDIASEFRYREAPMEKGGLAIFVSHRGDRRHARVIHFARKATCIRSIVNVPSPPSPARAR